MSLAKQILDEANEDITNTEFYNAIMSNIGLVIEGLTVLKEQFKGASSNTVIENPVYLDDTKKALNNICTILDKEGFTYYPQPTSFKNSQLSKVFGNFIEFYETYLDGFNPDDIEILNTNSKDLIAILDKLS